MAYVNSIGALFLSNAFSMMGLGFVLSKTLEYFTYWRKDRLILKAAVGLAVLGSIIESCCYISWNWRWAVLSYGDPEIMATIPTELAVVCFVVSFVTLVNQSFYSWRLRAITQSSVIPSIVLGLSLYQFGFIFWLMSYMARNKSFATFNSGVFPIGYSWLSSASAADLIITATMVYFLVIKPKRAGVPHDSSNIIAKIAWRTVQYNALSLVVQAAEFALLLSPNAGLWFCLLNSTLCKVLTFSLISSLTARNRNEIAGSKEKDSSTGDNISTQRKRGPGLTSGINVDVLSSVQVDGDAWAARRDRDDARIPVSVHFNGVAPTRGEKFDDAVEMNPMRDSAV